MDDALGNGNGLLEDYGLALSLILSPRAKPVLTLHGLQDSSPLQGDAPGTLTRAVPDILGLPLPALDSAARALGGKLDRACSQLTQVRCEPAGGPSSNIGIA